MAILEETRDTMGRRRRICPQCGSARFPGKAFKNDAKICYWCEESNSGFRKCSACKTAKSIDQFYKCDKFKSKLSNKCIPCEREYKNAWAKANPSKIVEYQRKYHTGVTQDQWDSAYETQSNCSICGRDWNERRPVTDHCHQTGIFRGLLCFQCNAGLGLFGDSIASLQKAIVYLGGE